MFSMLPFAYAVAISVTTIILFANIRRFIQGGQFLKRDVRLDGKVVIITGCNTGIGKETALDLARRGARVYMACRNVAKARIAQQEIVQITKNRSVFCDHIDLASMKSVRDYVKRFLKLEARLDILINNAGVLADRQHYTDDGFEMTIGVNHLGPFLLTNLLLNTIRNSAPSRIVNVASTLHRYGTMDKKRTQFTCRTRKIGAYVQSNLANVLFTKALAKRLHGSGVTVNCLHPGAVDTQIYRHQAIVVRAMMRCLSWAFKTPRSGAQTSIACAVDPALNGVTGQYFSDCHVSRAGANANDDIAVEWLWRTSEKLTGVLC